ncbi:MAG: hypothetical protein IKF91_01320 [Bacilli bacterium]|nr:hypothetical protein [Bacilli bacterium]
MNNYDDLFNKNTNSESLQNKRTEENIAALEDIFSDNENIFKGPNFEDTISLNSFSKDDSSSNYSIQKNESLVDSLEKTSEISNVDLETLRNYSKMLHDVIDKPKEEVQSSSSSNSNGKVLVKTSNTSPFKNNLPEDKSISEDMSQILQAFISCSILSFVTAGMGVGWLLYIIMHI